MTKKKTLLIALPLFALACAGAAAMQLGSVAKFVDIRAFYWVTDFRIGIFSQFLPGEILRHFKPAFTSEWLLRMFSATALIGAAVCGAGTAVICSRADEKVKLPAFIAGTILCTSCLGFPMMGGCAGIPDVINIFLSVIAILCLSRKQTAWLVPFICVICMANHYVFAVTLFPVLFVLLISRAIKQQGGKTASAALLGSSSLAVIASFLYVVFFQKKTLKMSLEQVNALIAEKTDIPVHYLLEPYVFGTVSSLEENGVIPEGALDADVVRMKGPARWFVFLKDYIALNLEGFSVKGSVLMLLCVIVPIIFFVMCWVKCLKKSETKGEKLLYFMPLLAFAAIPVMFAVSSDHGRYVSIVLVAQALMLLGLLADRDEKVCSFVESCAVYIRENPIISGLLIVPLYLYHC